MQMILILNIKLHLLGARSGSAWRAVITKDLLTFGGSSGVAVDAYFQAWFAVELRRKNCSLVTGEPNSLQKKT